ncbi:MAG: tRNA (cytidine(56)-2'-O)-methyltransferase [Candidatus Aenigmarchaeota archaeon]|nr:tRNA (cytidine(56)-2'-O)-methyltransferase [Candidatus Aenigmarchaeota archaeon]
MITVLRMGHRQKRDERLSTHVGLAARALGADEIIYSGEEDRGLIESVNAVAQRWGGKFSARYDGNWKGIIKKYKKKKFCIVHLTMYGISLKKKIGKIKKNKKILVIVGSEKVPPEVYQLADFNLAVTNQPHSEVAALAIFLHEYFKGKELDKKFPKAKIRIVPQGRGKKVLEK